MPINHHPKIGDLVVNMILQWDRHLDTNEIESKHH